MANYYVQIGPVYHTFYAFAVEAECEAEAREICSRDWHTGLLEELEVYDVAANHPRVWSAEFKSEPVQSKPEKREIPNTKSEQSAAGASPDAEQMNLF